MYKPFQKTLENQVCNFNYDEEKDEHVVNSPSSPFGAMYIIPTNELDDPWSEFAEPYFKAINEAIRTSKANLDLIKAQSLGIDLSADLPKCSIHISMHPVLAQRIKGKNKSKFITDAILEKLERDNT